MRRSALPTTLPLLAVGLLAFAARLLPVLRGGGLHGVLGYDDGVYFGAAEALLFGRLPYRDFVLLHPPGIVVALSPFAALARLTGDDDGALAAARIAFMCVGAANAMLVLHVARRRVGAAAGLAAGVLYAIWEPALYAERTTTLEPLVNLGVLGALALLEDPRTAPRRRLVAAGAALGVATAVKLWAVVPLVVLLGWVLLRRRRAAAPFAAGAAAGATVVCLPFFLAAPARMLRLVVVDQLTRTNNGVSAVERLRSIAGTRALAALLPASPSSLTVVFVGVVAVAGVTVLLLVPTARVWCALLAAQAALLLTSPSYFPHYGTYVAPALCLVVGAAAACALTAVRRLPLVRPLATATAVLSAGALLVAGQLPAEGRGRPGPQVDALVRSARCVAADTPETLEEADALAHDLRDGCPVLVDPTGLTYDRYRAGLRAGRTVRAREADTAWQRRIARWFARSQAVVLRRGNSDGLSRATLRSLGRDTRVRARSYDVYVGR